MKGARPVRRKLLLVLATAAGLLARRPTRLWGLELAGFALTVAGIAAYSVRIAAIVAGLTLVVAAEVRS